MLRAVLLICTPYFVAPSAEIVHCENTFHEHKDVSRLSEIVGYYMTCHLLRSIDSCNLGPLQEISILNLQSSLTDLSSSVMN